MKHLSQQDLVEQYFGDGPAWGRLHIKMCSACSAALAELREDLAVLDAAEVPERDAAYGDRVWSALEEELTPYVPPLRQRRRVWSWALSGAMACGLLVASFSAGRWWEHARQTQITAAALHVPPQNPPAAAKAEATSAAKVEAVAVAKSEAPVPAAPRVVVVVLSDHLERSERLLVELKHAENGADTAPLRQEARALLSANRSARQQIRRDKDPALAATLVRLDHLLGELSDTRDEESLVNLQREMQANGVLFEVRVLRSHLPSREGMDRAAVRGGKI